MFMEVLLDSYKYYTVLMMLRFLEEGANALRGFKLWYRRVLTDGILRGFLQGLWDSCHMVLMGVLLGFTDDFEGGIIGFLEGSKVAYKGNGLLTLNCCTLWGSRGLCQSGVHMIVCASCLNDKLQVTAVMLHFIFSYDINRL